MNLGDRNQRLKWSFIASLAVTSGISLLFYIAMSWPFWWWIGGYDPYWMMYVPVFLLILVPGTVLVWREMAIIFGVDETASSIQNKTSEAEKH